MRIGHFFVDRPRFALVLSILLILVGSLAYFQLPISQYPEISPPTVQVTAFYPGATPETVADTVATPLEQALNGTEGMLYMTSSSTLDGALNLTIAFALGTDLDTAQVQVQNRIASVEPRLPQEVRQLGVVVNKSSPDFLLVIHMLSPDDTFDSLYVSNYATLKIADPLRRIDGVGQLIVFGAREYGMRVWLDPDKLTAHRLTADDVVQALRAQNVQVSAGILGQPPAPSGVAFQVNLATQGRFETPEQFADVIVKTGGDGRITRVGDVARVELGAQDYVRNSYLNGTQAAGIGVFQRPGTNAIEAARELREEIERLSQDFPPGLEYRIAYDPTVYVEESVEAVYHTIFEAVGLVILVIVLFLQTWRAALIPIATIPVSLIGTFAVMAPLGFSLNSLSLFGLVLAIGIVVDDAIVVVENLERNLERGLSPREAAQTTMDEVGAALVSMALVLVAVFVPTAFLGGISGRFFQQFGVTIAVATVISAFNSLTLSPALGTVLLRAKHDEGSGPAWSRLLRLPFTLFNFAFERLERVYGRFIGWTVRHAWVPILAFLLLAGIAPWMVKRVPGGFVPEQDQGYLIIAANLPAGASLERTDSVMRQASDIVQEVPGIEDVVSIVGFNGATFATAPNAGAMFVLLEPLEERGRDLNVGNIVGSLYGSLAGLREGFFVVITPPPIRGLGTGGGFKMMVQDRSGQGDLRALEGAVWGLIGAANQDPRIALAFTTFNTAQPRYFVDIDRTKAEQLDVPLRSVFDTLQVQLGSAYVNDFNRFGRTYRVTAQADAEFRMTPDDLRKLFTRSRTGAMVPLGSLVELRPVTGTDRVVRYNLYPAAELQGAAAPGISSRDAIEVMEELAAEHLPPGFGYEWTELAYQEKQAGDAGLLVFPLSVLFVFLLLTAQYESFTLPLAVILIVPLCIVFALAGVWIAGMDNNVLTQIGFIVLIGLACKNAILIVEFAVQKEEEGLDRFEAAEQAARLRLRPIMMTSMAFILGVLPLVLSTGSGFEMRRNLGTAVFSGMIGVTILGLVLTPAFYVVIRRFVSSGRRAAVPATAALAGLALLLPGCKVGPTYKPPVTEVDPAFARVEPALTTGPVESEWWRSLEAPVLEEVMRRALDANHDLRIADANLRATRALLGVERRGLGPDGTVRASVERQNTSQATLFEREETFYSAGLDVTWEIDLFGRVRRSIEAASAEYEAAEADWRGARVAVAGAVARAYIDLTGARRRLEVARANLANQEQSLDMVVTLLDAGRGTELDRRRADSQLETTRASLPLLEATVARAVHRLAVLVGESPSALDELLAELDAPLAVPDRVAIGDPAELLRRRPDIAAAERRLAAATARIGVATADLFPRVSLSGSFGTLATSLDEVGGSSSRTTAFGPFLRWSAFRLGRVREQIRATEARADESLARYEQTVLRALEETENALVRFDRTRRRREHLARAERGAAVSADLARERYGAGLDSFLTVLDAESRLLAAQDALVVSGIDCADAYVELYLALGGV